MAGTAKVYFANRLTLTVNDGTTDHTLASLHGCEITVSWEHVEEYSMDSIYREDVSRVKQKVDVKVKYAKFNPVVAEWWMMGVLNGDADGPDGATEDTNNVALYTITGVLSDGAPTTPQKLQAAITEVYFPSLPMVFSENTYVQHDLAGVGKDITFSNPA